MAPNTPPPPASPAPEAYCVKCKARRPMLNPKPARLQTGEEATGGTCQVCGTKIYRLYKEK